MASPHSVKSAVLAWLAAVAGWLVPGLGHLLLFQWSRALAVFLCVGTLAASGMLLGGRLFTFTSNDFFDRLGFLADCGAGIFFYLAQRWDGAADVSRAAGDYGTRFFAAAGVLNLLAALDAYQIAAGEEHGSDEHRQPEPPETETSNAGDEDG